METTTNLVPSTPALCKPVLLKTDVLGRVRYSRQQREKILDEFEHSGVSGAEFAALVGVKYQTFATWVQTRKRERSTSRKRKGLQATRVEQVKWLEAVLPEPPGGAGLLLHLPGGIRAELTSNRQVALAAALVRALEKPC